MMRLSLKVFLVVISLISLRLCYTEDDIPSVSSNTLHSNASQSVSPENIVTVKGNVIVEKYFAYIDSIVKKYDSITPYKLSEHLLVHANPWIIDTLQNTDYYRMKARDSFVYDQKKIIVLPKDASIGIPDSIAADIILNSLKNIRIDINIPEFKLRIYEDSTEIHEFLIRVGRHEKKYLEMSGRVQDLKTRTGTGKIVRHFKNPKYVNPVNNHEYLVTKRDDYLVTKLPQIPSMETEINGLRSGQLIHTTTNPVTLGKAYSNGCIGISEADAWVIYYYAPIDTKIQIRYELNVLDEEGNKIVLKDIYRRYN